MQYKNNLFFISKNPEVNKIMDKLLHNPAIRIDTNMAKIFSRHKKIRILRENNHLFIGLDRPKRVSILYKPPNVTIEKQGNGYIFNFF